MYLDMGSETLNSKYSQFGEHPCIAEARKKIVKEKGQAPTRNNNNSNNNDDDNNNNSSSNNNNNNSNT